MALNIGPWPFFFDLEAEVVVADCCESVDSERFVSDVEGSFFASLRTPVFAGVGAGAESDDALFAGAVLFSDLVGFVSCVFAFADGTDDCCCGSGVRR